MFGIESVKSKEKIQVTLFTIYLSMTEMSRLIVTLLMHWQITFLIILPLLSAQMLSSDSAEVYNKPLSMEELRDALRRAHDTSAGPDALHYQLLKHLPDASLLLLLNIFNNIWLSGDFPSDWRKAIVIPIPKPGKDPTNPTNYRPIALTSCICKTMERMINRRLVWYLESHKLLTNVQCGFRSNRTTVDHLVRFETFCREAFIHNQHLVSVFFDLEKYMEV